MRQGESKKKRTFAGPAKNHCDGCGRTNKQSDIGVWFWANSECSICSDCAKVKIAKREELLKSGRNVNFCHSEKFLNARRTRVKRSRLWFVTETNGRRLGDSVLVPMSAALPNSAAASKRSKKARHK